MSVCVYALESVGQEKAGRENYTSAWTTGFTTTKFLPTIFTILFIIVIYLGEGFLFFATFQATERRQNMPSIIYLSSYNLFQRLPQSPVKIASIKKQSVFSATPTPLQNAVDRQLAVIGFRTEISSKPFSSLFRPTLFRMLSLQLLIDSSLCSLFGV